MQMINFRMQIKIFQNKRKRTIQMEFIQYKLKSNKINRKLIDYKKKIYTTKRKDRTLQHLTCQRFHMLTVSILFDRIFNPLLKSRFGLSIIIILNKPSIKSILPIEYSLMIKRRLFTNKLISHNVVIVNNIVHFFLFHRFIFNTTSII